MLQLMPCSQAEEMFWKSIEMHQLNPDQSEFRVNKAKSLMNIAETYARRGDYQRAVDSTLKVLEVCLKNLSISPLSDQGLIPDHLISDPGRDLSRAGFN